jgi:hypothetical protein
MNFSPRTLLIYVISQASRGAHVRIVLGMPKYQKILCITLFDWGIFVQS